MTVPIEVIIPTRNTPDKLWSLIGQIAATAGCSHHIIFTGLDASASVNRNYGLRQVSGEAVVMVDDDIEFPEVSGGWLRVMAEALARPEVVMVSAQLLKPDRSFAYMTGLQDCGLEPKCEGESVVPSKRLLTACCGFKHHELKFDENFIGSGFEDIDFCNQLALAQPDGIFVICHSAWAVHRNEAKCQRGHYWQHNRDYYNKKWGENLQ